MILLTGATGNVGSALLRRVVGSGQPVRALVRDPRRLGPERVCVQIALGNLSDASSFRNALRGVTTVVHLAAAIRKKEVPIVMVTDRDQADFEITGTHEKKEAGWAKTIFVSPQPSATASMQVVNLKTKVVVYADSSHRTSANRGERSTAEKLAKYLKEKIENDEKKSK